MDDEPIDPGFEDDEEELSPEELEARISGFIASADELEGPSSEELVEQTIVIVARAWDEVGALLAPYPTNKVLGAMLQASRLSREAEPVTRDYWIASATSTMLTGHIPPAKART